MGKQAQHESSWSLNRTRSSQGLTTAAGITAVLLTAGTLARAQDEAAKAPDYSVFYAFTGGTDGSEINTLAPYDAGMIRDKEGNLYGTAYSGGYITGGFSACPGGCGVV